MRIGIDARTLALPRPRGTGRNLHDAYRLIPARRPDNEFILFHQHPLPDTAATHDALRQHPNVRTRRIDMPGDRFDAWFQLRLPLAAWRERIDLLHFPANAAPAWCPVPFVVTIHDLVPLKLPGELSPARTAAFRRGVARAVRHAAHIIAVSGATRDDLHRGFGVPFEQMTVIPWAADTRIAAAARRPLDAGRRQRLRSKYALRERWLMTFSGSTYRKNARGVLDAFARVAPHRRRDTQVVLIGCEPATYRTDLACQAERLGIAGQCRILGFVPHDDLSDLLRGAGGLLMPSRYEGFGLPILDAFACGVPVLTSNVSSMPEVAGGAALLCDPNDTRCIAEGIEQLLEPGVAAELVRKGHERLSAFSWERTAEAVCAVYDKCLTEARPRRSRRPRRLRPLATVSAEGLRR